MLNEEVVMGTPSACMLPAARYRLQELTGLCEVEIPIRGEYPEGKGAYNIIPQEGVILVGAISQVLLNLGRYPKLEDNQLFVLSGLEVSGENSLIIVGKVYQFAEEENDASPAEV
jgi:hypothetical protein